MHAPDGSSRKPIRIFTQYASVITTGTVSTAHHELDFNGERHYYENRIFPLDEEYVLIMCRDITERVATQRQLEVFKSVLDKVSDSILAVAGDGTLVYANKQFIEEYGVTQELGTQKVYDLRVSMTDGGVGKRLQDIRAIIACLSGGLYTLRAYEKEVHQVSAFLIRENNQELIWFLRRILPML